MRSNRFSAQSREPVTAAPPAWQRTAGLSVVRYLLILGCVAGGAAWFLADRWTGTPAAWPAGDLAAVEPAAGPVASGGERVPDLVAVAAAEIETRRQALDLRERDLTAREQALQKLAEQLRTELAALETARHERDADKIVVAQEDEARAARLARLYENMKPKRAASIFDQTPTDDLLPIARHMRDAKAALVIQQMSPDRASDLSARLARP